MKDTALAALKRSAKAVLKDELKAMRAQTRAKQAEVDELRGKLTFALSANRLLQIDLGRVVQQRDHAEGQHKALLDRAHRAYEWSLSHADKLTPRKTVQCLTEWAYKGTGGPGFGIVHPFDRWGISPKP